MADEIGSRDAILSRIRSQAATKPQAERMADVEARISSHKRGILPAGPRSLIKRVERFTQKAEAAQSTVAQVSRPKLAKAVSEWLREHNLPAEIRIGQDPRLSPLKKSGAKLMTVNSGKADPADITGVSFAECGIAESGTIAMLSGKANPTTLNFVPENHITIVNESDILSHYEELWPRLRRRFGRGKMPRTVNFITGPSRSADIEQTLILGAHGPVRHHIIIVKGA